MDLFNYSRRETSVVNIGATPLGGDNPIRIQSMTNTATQDTDACVAQAKRIADAGGEYVRLTTQGVKEAENLRNINAALRRDGYMTPLVADVHFNPRVADVAALYAEKVRINPGNYVDAARTFKHLEYTDEEYAQELQKMLRAKGVECHIEPDMEKAVKKCFEVAKKGDSVLFSPGFSSFGMFSGYAERGKSFDEAVLCLKNLKTAILFANQVGVTIFPYCW